MRMNQKLGFIKLQFMLTEFLGLGRAAVLSAIILVFVVLGLGIFLFFYLAVRFYSFGHFVSKRITDNNNGFPKTPNN